jgi:hypothetical protein
MSSPSSRFNSRGGTIVPADLHVEDVAEKYESLRWGNVFDRLYDPTTCEYTTYMNRSNFTRKRERLSTYTSTNQTTYFFFPSLSPPLSLFF